MPRKYFTSAEFDKLPFFLNAPWKAQSISDFWRRWNIGLHYAFKNILIFVSNHTKSKLLKLLSIFTIFVFNGLLHDLFITLLIFFIEKTEPFFFFRFTIFFAINGFIVVMEKILRLDNPNGRSKTKSTLVIFLILMLFVLI